MAHHNLLVTMRERIASGPIFNFLLVGLFVRLLLAPFLGHPFDLQVFMAVGWAVARGITPYGQYTLQSIFTNTPHVHLHGTSPGIGYPPPWGLICGLMYLVSAAPNNIYAYVFALKIPIILGDVTTAFVIYKILKTEINEQIASKACLLYLFCPYVISVGVIWGMFDVLALLFTLLSAYHLSEKRELSSIFLAIASALKLMPIVLAPLYSIFIYKSTSSWKRASFYFFSVISLVALLTLAPMMMFDWPLSNLYFALSYHVFATNSAYYSKAGFSYGAASPFNAIDLLNNVSNPTVQLPWILNYLWIGACVVAYVYATRRVSEVNFASTTRWSLLTMLTFFTTRAWVSDPNLLFLFSFFLLTILFSNPPSWKTIHASWMLFFSFVMIHVPAIAFLWIPYPWTLNEATAFCSGSMGWVRLLIMSILTLAWLGILWHHVIRRVEWQ